MIDLPSQTEILVAGSGPSGLALGAELRRLAAEIPGCCRGFDA